MPTFYFERYYGKTECTEVDAETYEEARKKALEILDNFDNSELENDFIGGKAFLHEGREKKIGSTDWDLELDDPEDLEKAGLK